MVDLEKVFQANRMKQQKKIVQESLRNDEKKNVLKVQEVDKLEDKNREKASEQAVRELGIDCKLIFLN